MPAGYVITTEGAQPLTAATAETMLNFINAANSKLLLVEFSVSFDGVTATAVPVLVELCHSTQAGAGTSSSATIRQIRGATRTVQGTAERQYTVEPTVITVLKEWLVRPDGGLLHLQFPLGREPEQNTTLDGLLLRATAPATVNARASMEVENG